MYRIGPFKFGIYFESISQLHFAVSFAPDLIWYEIYSIGICGEYEFINQRPESWRPLSIKSIFSKTIAINLRWFNLVKPFSVLLVLGNNSLAKTTIGRQFIYFLLVGGFVWWWNNNSECHHSYLSREYRKYQSTIEFRKAGAPTRSNSVMQ